MSVAALSLSDLAAQTQSANLSATANGWQQFQDFLKSAIDQNAQTEANTNAPTTAASNAASPPMPASSSLSQAEASEAATLHHPHPAPSNSDSKRVAGSDDAGKHHGNGHKTAAKDKDAEDATAQKAGTTVTDSTAAATPGTSPTPVVPSIAAATPSSGASGTGASTTAQSASEQVVATATASAATDNSGTENSTASQTNQAPPASAPPPVTTLTPNAVVTAAAAALSQAIPPVTAASTSIAKASAALAATASAVVIAASASSGLATALPTTGAAAITASGALAVAGRQAVKDNGTAAALAAGPGASGDAAAASSGAVDQGQTAQAQSDSGDGTASEQNGGDQARSDAQSNSTAANTNQGGLSAPAPGPASAPASAQTAVNALLAQLQAIPVVVSPTTAAAATPTAARLATGDGASSDPAIGDASGDPSQATGGVGLGGATFSNLVPARAAESGASTPSPYAPSQGVLPAEQVALAIGRLANGARSYSMQLNPEHLGTVDVRMDVDSKGKTKVSITADRPETLALLKLDSHHLVRALQDSGVATDSGSLNFSLREQGSNSGQERQSSSGASTRSTPVSTADTEAETDLAPVRTSLSRHLYDIRA